MPRVGGITPTLYPSPQGGGSRKRRCPRAPSPPRGHAVLPWIRAADQEAVLAVDDDHLAAAQRPARVPDLMPAFAQSTAHLLGNARFRLDRPILRPEQP